MDARAMRVLMLTPSPPAPVAASAVPLVAWAQLTALRERHEVTVATTVGPDAAEGRAVERLRADGTEVIAHRRALAGRTDRAKRWIRDATRWIASRYPMYVVWHHEPALQRALDRLLAERRFDLVHVNDSAMGSYRLRTTAPRLLVEIEVRAPRATDWRRPLRDGWYRGTLDELDWHRWPGYQRTVWRSMHRIEVFTARDARVLAELAPEVAARVRVNAFGVDLPAVGDPRREEENTIVFIGTYTHAPNVDAARWLAREIMPLVRTRHPAACLHLVGADPHGAIAGLAGDAVTVTGWVPSVESVLERATVVAAPVRIGGGQRMKVLQAMAVGKAIVTTTRGAEGVMTAGTSLPAPLLVGDTVEEIADALSRLLGDRSARRELGRRARAVVVEHHSATSYGTRIQSSYEELLRERDTVVRAAAGASR